MGILRILLAFSVLASHVGPILGLSMIGGQLAVQTFFIISGFYMSMILNEKYVGINKSFKLFITNRLLRLYPLYAFILLFSMAICLFIGFTNKNQGYPVFSTYYAANTSICSYLFLGFSHLFIIGQDMVMFLGIDTSSGNLFFTSNFWNTSPQLYTFLFIQQAWSLALELAFYFVAPLILKRRLRWICGIIGLSFMLRIFIYYFAGLQNDPWTYRFFPTEILFFLLGRLSYRIYSKLKESPVNPLYGRVLSIIIVAYSLMYPFIPATQQILFQYSWKDIVYFGAIVSSIPFIFAAFKKNKLDAMVGELSYPVYMSHLLIARICWIFDFEWMHTSLFIALATLTFSLVLNATITRPIEKYRQKRLFKQQQKDSQAIAILSLVANTDLQNDIVLNRKPVAKLIIIE